MKADNQKAEEQRHLGADEELELSDEQAARNDEIYGAVFELCKVLTEDENLVWDMAFIGLIAEDAAAVLAGEGHGFQIRFPAVVTDDDGRQEIQEYYNDADRW
ncbi:hypothetical protein [Lactonifactor longoviformis]|uniref:hypothetical protein n=1 Tax=Lactonifactor longoviformis TaxID=341220 RepID=UPI0036F27F8A